MPPDPLLPPPPLFPLPAVALAVRCPRAALLAASRAACRAASALALAAAAAAAARALRPLPRPRRLASSANRLQSLCASCREVFRGPCKTASCACRSCCWALICAMPQCLRVHCVDRLVFCLRRHGSRSDVIGQRGVGRSLRGGLLLFGCLQPGDHRFFVVCQRASVSMHGS